MDELSFDRLTLRIGRLVSRRAALGGLGLAALAISDLTAARKKRKKKRNKKTKPCRPESPAATCAGRCGTVANNCQQAIACLPCTSGQFCLGSANCATVRDPHNDECPAGCRCPSYFSTEGANYCLSNEQLWCENMPCASTSECPVGSVCQLLKCSQGDALDGRCLLLCHA